MAKSIKSICIDSDLADLISLRDINLSAVVNEFLSTYLESNEIKKLDSEKMEQEIMENEARLKALRVHLKILKDKEAEAERNKPQEPKNMKEVKGRLVEVDKYGFEV